MTDQSNSPKDIPDGLPEIAQDKKINKSAFLVFTIACLIVIFILFFHNKSAQQKSTKALEEDFTVAASNIKSNNSLTTSNTNKTPEKKGQNPEELKLLKAKQAELARRLEAPVVMVKSNENDKLPALSDPDLKKNIDPYTHFMKQVSAQGVETSTASRVSPLNQMILQGNLISAVLETAINSDLPGMVRAIVDQPVYSEDGSQILIPPGSRLIGQYRSSMMQGQERVYIIWSRVIAPGGISIMVDSPGTDAIGQAGLSADAIDRHFIERFGNATLLAIIGAGAANIGVNSNDPFNSTQAYRMAVSESFAESANTSLQQQGNIPPTLAIHQGTPIFVFVNKDLNFANAMKNGNGTNGIQRVF